MQPITSGGAARRPEENPESAGAPQGASKAGAAQPGSKPSGAEEADAPRGAALLAQQSSSRKTASATLTGLQSRYPEAGVDVQRIVSALASHGGSAASVRLKATQQFVQAALKSNPSLGGRFLEDMHLKHMPAGVRALVQQGTAGQSGASLYSAGLKLANQLNGLKGAELQRVTELAKTKPLQAAMSEVLTARSASRAAPVAQAKPAISPEAAEMLKTMKHHHAAAVDFKQGLARNFSKLNELSRGAELGWALMGHVGLPSQLPGAGMHAVSGDLEPAKGIWRQMTATNEMARGVRSERVEAAKGAYGRAMVAVDRYIQAIEAYQKALSQTPVDDAANQGRFAAVNESLAEFSKAFKSYTDASAKCAQDDTELREIQFAFAVEVTSALASFVLAPVGGPAAVVVAKEVVRGAVVSEVVGQGMKTAVEVSR